MLAAAVATAAATVIFGLLWELGAPLAAVVVAPPSVGGGVAWLLLHRPLRRRRIAAREFPAAWRRTLKRYVRYYTALRPDERARFERDVAVFIDDAEITGINATVTDEVCVLIASSAVMLVFGRPGWEYTDLPEILVYPAAFDEDYRCATRHEFVGRLVPRNAIVLSRPALIRSFRQEAPYHVGLHEFAHLLDLEDDRFDGVPRGLDLATRRRWQGLVESELARARRGDSVLDDYARTNEVELFAVAVEWFFKAPRRLRARHRELYDSLAEYLGQEPAGSR